jgi:pSer/pThr/pTyr-binding forkhead associated (FHA) protein
MSLFRTYSFSTKDSPIFIGRHKSCHISLDDKTLSRVHSTIEFNKLTDSWWIRDGLDKKCSTNGTWYWFLILGYIRVTLLK